MRAVLSVILSELESRHHDYLLVAISPMQWHIGRPGSRVQFVTTSCAWTHAPNTIETLTFDCFQDSIYTLLQLNWHRLAEYCAQWSHSL